MGLKTMVITVRSLSDAVADSVAYDEVTNRCNPQPWGIVALDKATDKDQASDWSSHQQQGYDTNNNDNKFNTSKKIK